jgi:hypothetical protein
VNTHGLLPLSERVSVGSVDADVARVTVSSSRVQDMYSLPENGIGRHGDMLLDRSLRFLFLQNYEVFGLKKCGDWR